ncbi:MAG: DUF1569 domain-containing protein [Gemmatimonadota bacterium]
MFASIFDSPTHAELIRRLEDLSPDHTRQWGRMTPHQAVCHLADSFRAILGDRPLRSRDPDITRFLMRVYAFTLPIPWPKGVPTSAAVDAERDGTRPGDFDRDVAELTELIRRFVATDGRTLAPHYAWGTLTRGEWGRYAFRHIDHHFSQFGV